MTEGILSIETAKGTLRADISRGTDLSIPVVAGERTVNAFFIPYASISPLRAGGFVGSVPEGGACNCENISFNPHGNGTHTECIGHVSRERHALHDCLKSFFFKARVASVEPDRKGEDFVLMPDSIDFKNDGCEALIIRTLPNSRNKRVANYSGTNPTYLHPELALHIREAGIKHLLVDLPSVDREEDGGLLAAHKNFWNYPGSPRLDATITEFIYVPDEVEDGYYLLNLMVSGFDSDAVPSRPVVYGLVIEDE